MVRQPLISAKIILMIIIWTTTPVALNVHQTNVYLSTYTVHWFWLIGYLSLLALLAKFHDYRTPQVRLQKLYNFCPVPTYLEFICDLSYTI